MSKKLQQHVKRHNLRRSERAKKKMLKSPNAQVKLPRRINPTGTFIIRVHGEDREFPVGPCGYVPKGGVRQYRP